MMLGGYAVKSIDTTSGIEQYTDLKCLSGWIDLSTGKEIEFGLFAGYSKSLGATDNIAGSYFFFCTCACLCVCVRAAVIAS